MDAFISRLKSLIGDNSVTSFARSIGVAQQTLDNYLRGRDPKASFVYRLCLELGVSADWLLGLSDDPSPASKRPASVSVGSGAAVVGSPNGHAEVRPASATYPAPSCRDCPTVARLTEVIAKLAGR